MMNMNNRYRNNINRNCNQNVSAVMNNSSPEKKNDECVEVETVSKDVSAQGCGCNTNVNIRNMDRKVCLKKIYELGFAITETALYLDTHPEDKDALEYYCGIRITHSDPTMAAMIISQDGGPDGESAASMRYLSQRYSMPYREVSGLLTDIGTEELAHLEMVSTIVHQLTKNLTIEQIKRTPFEAYYVDHTVGIWPQAAGGIPFTATEFQSKGDAITDLVEDMAAEQKARTTYDKLIRLVKDPDVLDPLRFLREREIVHFQRFGEALRIVQDKLDSKNFYAFNPEFDKK